MNTVYQIQYSYDDAEWLDRRGSEYSFDSAGFEKATTDICYLKTCFDPDEIRFRLVIKTIDVVTMGFEGNSP